MGNILSTPTRPFRFLDLPAELRNAVYFLTLNHNRQTGSKATPALLRTCKQVYAEAIGVLNAQSTLSIKISPWTEYMFEDWDIELKGDINYHGMSWHSALRNSTKVSYALPKSTPQIRNLHLHFVHMPYFHKGVCKNNGKSSETHLFLRSLTSVLGENKALPRNITCTFERWPNHTSHPVYVTPESLGLQLMFEPLYSLPATTTIEVVSSAFEMPKWLSRYGLSGSEQRAAATNAIWKDINRQVQAIIDRDVMARIASRPRLIAETEELEDASSQVGTS